MDNLNSYWYLLDLLYGIEMIWGWICLMLKKVNIKWCVGYWIDDILEIGKGMVNYLDSVNCICLRKELCKFM